MKRIFALLIIAVICVSPAHAGKSKVEAVIAKDKDTKPAKTFAADVKKLYAFFRTKGTERGDKLRGVWIAEDVGDAAPANTKIDEASLTAEENDFYGAFSITKPTKGWPAGKYRVEIYAGDDLATTVKFTIEGGKSDEGSDDESNDDSAEE
jgi:photosystem II stability/assembly factor-like uncharacterized protein